jgi:dolichol-phosphate mannosyltransferase
VEAKAGTRLVGAGAVSLRPHRKARSRAKGFDTLFGFALVGATGILVNQAILWALVQFAHLNYVLAAVIATQGSTTWNFALNEVWVFGGRASRGGVTRRYVEFWAINNATLLVRAPLLALFTSVLGIHYLVSNLLTLVILFAVRFGLSDRIVWRAAPLPRETGDHEEASAVQLTDVSAIGERTNGKRAATAFSHNYDIHGLVSVASQVRLPELEYFRVSSLIGGADIEISVGNLGVRPRWKVKVEGSPGEVSYEEQLGILGANFHMDISDRIRVKVSPLLSGSPHVVYTNVIEALLRFVLVSRDHALLHSACLDLNGHGVMMSAHTDTGKTATILRMLREEGGVFLSDDMSIISPDRRVRSYPKPLTISHHTLAAIDMSAQSRVERAVLVVKSSLHSKEGRQTGMRLARMNLPIMSMNAVTQALIPPPKYAVDSLVPCQIGVSTMVERLFLIARGPRRDEPVETDEALEALTENTDDAYGFPPFDSFAPVITLGGEDYLALRRRERSILRHMLEGVVVQRLTRDDFSWADDIPKLVQNGHSPTTPRGLMVAVTSGGSAQRTLA